MSGSAESAAAAAPAPAGTPAASHGSGPDPLIPVPRGPLPVAPAPRPRGQVELTVDGRKVSVPEGATLLDAARQLGIATPTLCYLENLTPVNVCRICVVEVEGARTLVPACSRKADAGMVVSTDSPRVRLSRRLVLELLASSVDVSTAPTLQEYMATYDALPARFGEPAPPAAAGERDAARPGHHEPPRDASSLPALAATAAGAAVAPIAVAPIAPAVAAATVAQPVKVDNELYVRDYSKCILCYKCVEACGKDAQNTFAIALAGRGFDARISTEYDVPLPDSACVYCGNCIGVCPTGALMFKSEHDLRQAGTWDEESQTKADTICPYCGVGCTLTVHVQDERIVKVDSPIENETTHGHLCIKGRFGWEWVNLRK
jgi:predicted molibdopterin-dependent oxidoreductase YjgC